MSSTLCQTKLLGFMSVQNLEFWANFRSWHKQNFFGQTFGNVGWISYGLSFCGMIPNKVHFGSLFGIVGWILYGVFFDIIFLLTVLHPHEKTEKKNYILFGGWMKIPIFGYGKNHTERTDSLFDKRAPKQTFWTLACRNCHWWQVHGGCGVVPY